MVIFGNLLKNLGLGLTLSALSLTAFADVASLPVKDINGRSCHYYLVQPKETIYSITHKLGITKEELLQHNPGAADGLKAGEILVFPVSKSAASPSAATQSVSASSASPRSGAKPSPASQNADSPVNAGELPMTHTVQKGETLFGIARKYRLTANDLLAWNSEASGGLKSGMVLRLRPSAAPSSKTPSTGAVISVSNTTHVIKDGETLYKIAKEHGTSVNDIMALNPGLDRNHYSAGQTINLPMKGNLAVNPVKTDTPDNKPEAPDVRRSGNGSIIRYVVKEGETLYSISRAHGVTIEELEACNPGLTVLRKGMTLLIPDVKNSNEEPRSDSIPATKEDKATVPSPTPEPSTPPVQNSAPVSGYVVPDMNYQTPITQNHPVKVAVALPFMASSENRPKSSQLFTDFYRGLLISVDSLRNSGRPIYLYAYDTCDNMDTLRNILGRPEMKGMNAIIAPDDEAQLREIAFFGRANNIPVINAFVVKDNSYRFNPSVMQCNIPHTDMYDKAIREITSNLNGATPVILESKSGVDDKSEYINLLKKSFADTNRPYEVISFNNQLSLSNLSKLKKDGKYVFVPVSGKQAEFNKIAPALIEFRDRSTRQDAVKLVGYPEWITFRGESLSNLHKLNASVYSRFYSIPEDMRTISFDQTFSRWYGSPSANYLPNQGMLGFDLGMYLFKALRAPGSLLDNPVSHTPMTDLMTAYNGVQNGFRFTTLPHAGSVNNVLYYITFNPGGSVSRKML